MKIKLIELSGFVSSLTALRKPYKKDIKSDIRFEHGYGSTITDEHGINIDYAEYTTCDYTICESDLSLMSNLVKAGNEHAKCIRGIRVTVDISAPRYFWSEHDTYRIGVDSLCSESTMHTILKDDIDNKSFEEGTSKGAIASFKMEILANKDAIDSGNIPKSEAVLNIKRCIPESFIQTRTIQYSYQALRRIYFQRRNHRLPVWRDFCKWIETLPYAKELIINS